MLHCYLQTSLHMISQ